MSFIQVNKISKKIKDKVVLDDISINFEKGQIYGLVGANGSGKTMLLRALCGFIKLDEGYIKINNDSIIFNEQLPINIGLILETPNFVTYQTAWENLKFLLSLNNRSDKYAEELLKYFDLWELKDKKIKDYSLGMRQKLGIIQSIMEDQEVLLLDEPTNGLDQVTIEKFIKLIKFLKKKDKTIIIASHHEYEIKELSDKIIRINEGKIVNEK